MKQLEEAEQAFQAVEKQFLEVVFLLYLEGKLSDEYFASFLNDTGLAEKFLKDYMDVEIH